MSNKALIAGMAIMVGSTAAGESAENAKAMPEPGAAYVAVTFHAGLPRTVLVVADENHFGHDIVLSAPRPGIASTYAPAGAQPPVEEWQTVVVRLPPDTYMIDAVEFFADELVRWEPGPRLFVLQPGHVVFLGRFVTSTRHFNQELRIDAVATPADEPIRLLRRAYPLLASLPIECLLCDAPTATATDFAMPAVTPPDDVQQPDSPPLPDGPPASDKAPEP